MNWKAYFVILVLNFGYNSAVRLHKLFLFLDGFKSEHDLEGFLHVGNDYVVFLRKPSSHAKFLIYELYEANNVNADSNNPRLLAISKVPVTYIKDQLKTFRSELYKAKYVDDNIVPGTQVKTLREWQIDRTLNSQNKGLDAKKPVLRALIV